MSRFDDNESFIRAFFSRVYLTPGSDRAKHGNLRYENNVLYSYDLPIASTFGFNFGFILSSAYAPSPTTQRHINTAHAYVPPSIALPVAIVPTSLQTASEAHQLELHTANQLHYHNVASKELQALLSRRTAPSTKHYAVLAYNRAVSNHHSYCHHFALLPTSTSLHPFAPPLPLTQALPPEALALLALNNIDPTTTD
jgi:hypothetical protein